MALIKSKSSKAVGKNIKKELAAGKPKKQAVAIALSVQRKAKGQSGKKFNPNKYESTRRKVFQLPKDY